MVVSVCVCVCVCVCVEDVLLLKYVRCVYMCGGQHVLAAVLSWDTQRRCNLQAAAVGHTQMYPIAIATIHTCCVFILISQVIIYQ